MKTEGLGGAVGLTHLFLRRVVVPGDVVVDATCGNGFDTLFLARLVGDGGRVWAFDLQAEAIRSAEARLDEAGCLSRVKLVNAGHERLDEYLKEKVRAVVFNLGYLPGVPDGQVTCADSTLAALDRASELLLPGGIITVALYTGHPGGAEEAAMVEKWAAGLPPRGFNSWKSRQLNRSELAPFVIVVERQPSGRGAKTDSCRECT
ncbi:MAG: class I SAM-dependent methyltransferase [Geobacteraceae bacterium]|nr:class I SAM-dependent methyltransferase [Geobacteraceae bacterium]